ncbi:MAG: TonB-dependent receptor [Chitinispirillaceae bacterium]|nr:TonB-dependent receptor [Chitinispirillaceae bacterium]
MTTEHSGGTCLCRLVPAMLAVSCTVAAAGTVPGDSVRTTFDKITVTATRKPTPLRDVPSITYVASSDEIDEIQASKPSEALQYIPGVSVEGGTGSGSPSKRNISLNGMPNQYSVVLVDGVRVLSSHFHTGGDIDIIPAANVERIEVLKDAASAQYGSDCMAGIVNIITRRGTDQPYLSFGTGGGSERTFYGNLLVSGKTTGKVYHSAFASWKQTDGLPIKQPARRMGQLDFKNFSLMNRIDADLSEKASIGMAVNYHTIASTFNGAAMDSRLFMPRITYDMKISDRIGIQSIVYYSRWESEINGELNEVASPQVSLWWNGIRRNRIMAGIEYDWRNFARKAVSEHHQHLGGIYLQDEIQLFKGMELLAAVRADLIENTGDTEDARPVFSPRISALYRPVDPLGIRFSAGRGFKAPTVMELYEKDYPHGNYRRNGNPDLLPEYLNNISGGIDWSILPDLTLIAQGYANFITDMITPVYDHNIGDSLFVYVRRNIHKAKVYGGELMAGYRMRAGFFGLAVQAGGGYAYNESTSTGSILPYYPGLSLFAKVNPTFDIGSSAAISLFAGMRLLQGREVQDYKSNGATAVTDNEELEAGLTATFLRRYELYVKGTNLLARELEWYEDALMQTEGKRLFEAGVKIRAF